MTKCNAFIAFLICFYWSATLHAQCDFEVELDSIIRLCESGNTEILAEISGDFENLQWRSKTDDILSTQNPFTLLIENNDTLFLDVFSLNLIDEITNGDFDLGATGFETEYALMDPNNGNLWTGHYIISDNPNDIHSNFTDCGTLGGNGNMMIVNGSEDMTNRIWCQTITTVPNAEYVFRARAASVHPQSPAKLRFSINGQLIGQQLDLPPFFPCIWEDFEANWTAVAAEQAEICITNQNTESGGNDFALDDIFFGTNCRESFEMALAVNDLMLSVNDGFISCLETDVLLSTDIDTGQVQGDLTFAWTTQDGQINGNPFLDSIRVNTTGTYTVIATDAWGCTHTAESVVIGSSELPTFQLEASPDYISCDEEEAIIELTNLNTLSPLVEWSKVGETDIFTSTALTVDEPGMYEVTVTDLSTNCSSIALQEIMDFTQAPAVNLEWQDIDCFNELAVVINTAHSPDMIYSWSSEAMDILADQANFSEGGMYSLQVENSYGCDTVLNFEIIEDLFEPSYELAAINIACEDDFGSVSLDAVDLGISWTWYTDTEALGNDAIVDISEESWVYIDFIDDEGCTLTDSVFVVDERFDFDLSIIVDPISCANSVGELFISAPQAGVSYTWVDAFGIELSNEPFLETSITGEYTLIAEHEDGCSDEASTLLFEEDNDFSSFSIALGPAICDQDWVDILDITAMGGIAPYRVFIDGVELADNTSLGTIDLGSHNILLLDANGCEKDSTILVEGITPLSLDYTSNFNVNFGEEIELLIESNKTLDDANITWISDPALSCIDCFSPIFTATQNQSLSFSVIDADGCEREGTIQINISENNNVFIPNIISEQSSQSINESFTIYSTNALINRVITMNIYDRWGNLVFAKKDFPANDANQGWQPARDTPMIVPGVYVYLVEFERFDGTIQIRSGDITVVK